MNASEAKHIIFPIWRYTRHGGVKVLLQLCSQLIRQAVKSEIVVVGKIPGNNSGLTSPHVSLPVPGIVYAILDKIPRLAVMWDFWALIVLFGFFLRTPATHVICSYHLQLYSARAAQLLGRKRYRIIYYIQAYEPDFFPKPTLYQSLRRWLARKSYLLRSEQLVNSLTYHEQDPRITGNPERCIPPGIDLSFFRPPVEKRSSDLRVGTLYSPIKIKGSQTALAAFEILKKQSLPIDLTIGTSYLSSPLPPFNLFRIGNEKDLVAFYRSLDILVAVPCKQFGAPHLPIMEGMACGCVLVCTDFYLVRHLENAIMVPPEDPQSVAGAIDLLLRDPDLRTRLREGGQASVFSLDWNRLGKKFLETLVNLYG